MVGFRGGKGLEVLQGDLEKGGRSWMVAVREGSALLRGCADGRAGSDLRVQIREDPPPRVMEIKTKVNK